MFRVLLLVAGGAFGLASEGFAAPLDRAEIEEFAQQMHRDHGFDPVSLRNVLSLATRLDNVLATIAKPAESKPWYQYSSLFITPERVQGGVDFWTSHRASIDTAAAQFGVPAEIIVAIIGVETAYGTNAGNYRVLDVLGTLAFHYPQRAPFFRSELEQFLLLAREEQVDPIIPKGSYAGAMGIPQFMPSSYRAYAVDLDADGHRDIWANPADAIGSVANYLQRHGWQTDQLIVLPAVPASALAGQVSETVELKKTIADFARSGVYPRGAAAPDLPAVLLAYEEKSATDYWFGFKNFYVITRYNRSPKYALAVVQLADAIRQSYASGNH